MNSRKITLQDYVTAVNLLIFVGYKMNSLKIMLEQYVTVTLLILIVLLLLLLLLPSVPFWGQNAYL